jgi:hypothetical protein
VKKNGSSGFIRETAYRFDSISGLLAACHRLHSIHYAGESDAYRDCNAFYYLLLKTPSPSPFTLPDELQFLSECGSPANASHLRLYFREHGSVIRTLDAVPLLAALR